MSRRETGFVDAALVCKVVIFFRVFLSVSVSASSLWLFFLTTFYGLVRAVGMSWLGSAHAPSAG